MEVCHRILPRCSPVIGKVSFYDHFASAQGTVPSAALTSEQIIEKTTPSVALLLVGTRLYCEPGSKAILRIPQPG